MKTKRFGSMVLPAIGQGTGGNDVCDDKQRIRVLQYGIELGMTFIDTAEAYRNGHSEEIVGMAVAHNRDTVFIATKFSPEHNHYEGVMGTLEGSLERLKTHYIDLYQVHWPNPSVPIEETMTALTEAKKSGKVLHIGVSNFPLANFLQAQEVCADKIESNQMEYNLFERGIEEDFLPYSSDNEVMTIAYNPLLRGTRGSDTLRVIATKHNKTTSQVILNWIASHDTVVPIPKSLSLEHTRENALSADFQLEQEDLAELNKVFRREIAEIPTWQIRVQNSDQEPVYTTLEEALENRFNLTPGPRELADDLANNAILKPVRLKPSTDSSGRHSYDLIQGRIRYWAWIIARGPDAPIPAYIYD